MKFIIDHWGCAMEGGKAHANAKKFEVFYQIELLRQKKTPKEYLKSRKLYTLKLRRSIYQV